MTEKSNVQAAHDTLLEEFRRDERYILLGEDVGVRGGVFRVSDGFLEEFGADRIIDTPVAESSIVGIAIGAAIGGLRPVAEMQFADFHAPAFEQIVNEAARMRYRSVGAFGVPLVIRMPWGGGVRGALYHSQSVEAFYAHVPGLKVVAPSTPADITGLIAEEAFEALDAPVMRLGGPETPAMPFNKPQEDWFMPSPEKIAVKMRELAAY